LETIENILLLDKISRQNHLRLEKKIEHAIPEKSDSIKTSKVSTRTSSPRRDSNTKTFAEVASVNVDSKKNEKNDRKNVDRRNTKSSEYVKRKPSSFKSVRPAPRHPQGSEPMPPRTQRPNYHRSSYWPRHERSNFPRRKYQEFSEHKRRDNYFDSDYSRHHFQPPHGIYDHSDKGFSRGYRNPRFESYRNYHDQSFFLPTHNKYDVLGNY